MDLNFLPTSDDAVVPCINMEMLVTIPSLWVVSFAGFCEYLQDDDDHVVPVFQPRDSLSFSWHLPQFAPADDDDNDDDDDDEEEW